MISTIAFDKTSYGPSDPITFTVNPGQPMTAVVTVAGTTELPDGTVLPAETTTTVSGIYGPFTVSSDAGVTYAVTQDPDDPAVWHASPST